jgi:hypothetical protein
MSDATSVLFGLEDEFSVLEVQRVDVSSVKVIIEQTAREGPCPGCGVLSGAVKDRPVMRLKDLPVSGQVPRFAVGADSAGTRQQARMYAWSRSTTSERCSRGCRAAARCWCAIV